MIAPRPPHDRGRRDDHDASVDRALLADHLQGDPDAFGLLFSRHRDRLWAVALRTTGDPEDAADALQDAMVSAFRKADSYRGEAAVTTWLHRIVVNACLDRLRRGLLRRTEPLPEIEHEPDDRLATTLPGGPVDPARAAEDSERRSLLLRALATLPPEQRAALVLVDLEGFGVAEAASILRVPPGTVKSRCSRARVRLLPLLREAGLGNHPASPHVPSPDQVAATHDTPTPGGEHR